MMKFAILAVMLCASPLNVMAEDALSPAANAAFLAANGAKPGTILRPSGLQ